MYLVHRHRGLRRLDPGAGVQPLVVGPLERRTRHDRRGRRRNLGGERHGIGLVADDAVGPVHSVLVDRAGADIRDEQLPHAGRTEGAHREALPAPTVEISDDGDTGGGGCPHRERRATDVAVGCRVVLLMRAEDVPQAFVTAFAEQVEVQLAEGG
jgi:hypothetical protein